MAPQVDGTLPSQNPSRNAAASSFFSNIANDNALAFSKHVMSHCEATSDHFGSPDCRSLRRFSIAHLDSGGVEGPGDPMVTALDGTPPSFSTAWSLQRHSPAASSCCPGWVAPPPGNDSLNEVSSGASSLESSHHDTSISFSTPSLLAD